MLLDRVSAGQMLQELNTGKMKIPGVMARKGDASGYVHLMHRKLFFV
jgi:hypothetical protein